MDPSCGVKRLVRHFLCGLSLDPIQAQNAPHFNNAPAKTCAGKRFELASPIAATIFASVAAYQGSSDNPGQSTVTPGRPEHNPTPKIVRRRLGTIPGVSSTCAYARN